MKRTLTPEWLDSLPADDPGAKRSRRDLRRINAFMGNASWILRQLPKDVRRISELGAGDGSLLRRLAQQYREAQLCGYDLQHRPDSLEPRVEWVQGDVLDSPPVAGGGVLIANLILHHFTDGQLRDLGSFVRRFDFLVINEPRRARLPMALSRLATPFVNGITRHDMRVSIEAGFVAGEMPRLLGLSDEEYGIRESSTWRGSQRVLACRS
ncbi:MAG: class I SAM-dependent methyltransferase [Akkermansiaceae bacterium]|nr:class I SAM-dependent methyltransferase [Akkermansiaceae bacterium]